VFIYSLIRSICTCLFLDYVIDDYLLKTSSTANPKQGRIHGYISRVRLGRGSKKSLLASKQQNTRSKIDVNGPTDGPTDRPTDRPTDIASYRVACTRLKMTAFCFLVPTTNPFALVRVRWFGLRVRSSALCLSLLELRAERLSSASRIPSLFYVCFAFGGAGTRFFRLLQASHSLLHAPTAHFLVIST